VNGSPSKGGTAPRTSSPPGASGRVRWSHRVQYGLYRALAGLARTLPEGAALALGSGIGWFAGSVLRIRRRVVDENLARAFPDRDARWRRSVAVGAYRHLGRQGVILLRLARMGPEVIRERTEVEGLEHVERALSRGRGVVVTTGHLGNWEIGGASLPVRDIPLDVVARRQKNPLFDAHISRTRAALGMRVIYRADALREGIRALRAGGAIALVADQNARAGGGFVDFFGVPASTARGPAVLALRTGSLMVVAGATARPDDPGRYLVRLHPLSPPDTGDPDEDVRLLTRAYMAALEEMIREVPEQYFWLHRRWKTRPAALSAPCSKGD
jgi:Kdo2-lipid IVA lauroyltransferase/acyltransferase